MRIKAVALPLLALLWSHAALAAAPPWKVTEAAGQVHILHGSTRIEAARGATLAPRDVIETGPNGRAVIARGSDVAFVSPRTRLTIAPAEQARGLIQIIQDIGRATFMIERKSNPHFAVGTRYLATVVKGTVFTIVVDPSGASVSVREGRVEVSTPRNEMRQMVVTGMTASVTAASPERIDLRALPDRDTPGAADPAAAAEPSRGTAATHPSPGTIAVVPPTLDYILVFREGDEDEPPFPLGNLAASDLDLEGRDAGGPVRIPEPVLASAIVPLIPALPTAAPPPVPAPPPVVIPPASPAPAPAPLPPPPAPAAALVPPPVQAPAPPPPVFCSSN